MGPFDADTGMMRLIALLFLALTVVATGDGFLSHAAAPLVHAHAHESVEQAQGTVVVARSCFQRSGIAGPSGVICQADKRASDNVPQTTEQESLVSRAVWPAAVSGDGIDPTPALDPPRLLS